jgi:hypothetical protein
MGHLKRAKKKPLATVLLLSSGLLGFVGFKKRFMK